MSTIREMRPEKYSWTSLTFSAFSVSEEKAAVN
jgi:hypothetical protein